MKKLVLFLLIIGLFACKKEKVDPPVNVPLSTILSELTKKQLH